MAHHKKHHKSATKKAGKILKGIGKGAKGIAEEVKSFTPLGFLEKNPIMGTGIIIVAGVVGFVMLRR